MRSAPVDRSARCSRGGLGAQLALMHDSSPSTTRTAEWQEPPTHHAPAWITTSIRRVEEAALLDRPVVVLERLSRKLLRSPPTMSVLRGEPIGHALHPLLTDFPLGSFLSATLLDLFGGRRARRAATGLIGFGIAMVLPTAAAGMAEWSAAGERSRRVGVVHASVNITATSLYAASLVARLRGRHRRGVALALAGGTAAWIGGYLGGHLSLVRKIGTADPGFGAVPPPSI